MATITLKYDARNPKAKEAIAKVLDTGLFEKKTGIDEALEDVRKGRIYSAKNAKDLISKCSQTDMYTIQFTNKFKKDLKLAKKRGYDMSLLETALDLLQRDGKLPSKYKSHKLSGRYAGLNECHLKPDWLLVWDQNDDQLVLLLIATRTHSDLF